MKFFVSVMLKLVGLGNCVMRLLVNLSMLLDVVMCGFFLLFG